MKDPTIIWATQAAVERRRLSEAEGATPEQRAEWADDAPAEAMTHDGGPTSRLARLVALVRRSLRR